jgi:urease accessory protein
MRHCPLAAILFLLPAAALAHPGPHAHAGDDPSSFLAGLAHPLGGADHLLAMVAVGLWAGALGGRAALALPASFVALMAAGGVLGAAGLALPGVEPMILASVILLGAAVALALRPPLIAAVVAVALFGFAHGFAHSAEGPSSGFGAYALGFALCTAALHATGIVLATSLARAGRTPRLTGGATSLAGIVLVFL